MKNVIFLFLTLFTLSLLVSCGESKEERMEEQLENKADVLEEKADSLKNKSEKVD